MHTNYDIYKIFRKCQGDTKGSGYRLPKDWESHYKNKMTSENKLVLDTITSFFNTKWNNIDPETYFNLGFELFGMRFTYRKFLDRKTMLHYIQNDKMMKREIGLIHDDIKKSVDFVKNFIGDQQVGSKLVQYCSMKDGMLGLPVKNYLDNKISKSFIVLLMWHGYYYATEDELERMPYVAAQYRDVAATFNKDTLNLLKEIM